MHLPVWAGAGVTTIVVGALALSACSTADSASVPTAGLTGVNGRPVAASARIEARTEQITLPLDEFLPDDQEWHEVDYARDLLTSRCAQQNGVDYPLIDRRDEASSADLRYGVWSAARAKKYGYGVPPDSAQARQAESLNHHTWTNAESRVLDTCLADPRYEELSFGDIVASQAAATETYQKVLASAAGRRILDEWRSCLIDGGHSAAPRADSSPFVLGTASDESSTSNIALAVADVDCKQRTRLVQRLADAEAEKQMTVISEHQSELEQQTRRVRAVIASARLIISRG